MSDLAIGSRGRWVLSAGVAVAVTAAFLFLVRLPSPPTALPASSSPKSKVGPMVRLEPLDAPDLLLKQASELQDLQPMFLPTKRNAVLPEPRLEPGRTVLETDRLVPRNREAELQFGDGDLPAVATLNGKEFEKASPRDVFAGPEMQSGLQGFGRFEIRMTSLALRGGFVEVTALHTGQRVEFGVLAPEARPPTTKPWTPLEFMAVVEPAGLAVPLVVVEGSRVDEVDVHFKNFLTQTYRIGQRLNPGFYRITVSP